MHVRCQVHMLMQMVPLSLIPEDYNKECFQRNIYQPFEAEDLSHIQLTCRSLLLLLNC